MVRTQATRINCFNSLPVAIALPYRAKAAALDQSDLIRAGERVPRLCPGGWRRVVP